MARERSLQRCPSLAVVLIVCGSVVAVTVSTVTPAQTAPQEPIAYIGHGGFFDAAGRQLPVTVPFIEEAQAWYRRHLLSMLEPAQRSQFAQFEGRVRELRARDAQTRLILQQRALEWLLASAPAFASDDRMRGKLRALQYELRWQLPTASEGQSPDHREPFSLAPELTRKLQAPEFKLPTGGVHVEMATLNSGQAYVNECTAAGVPTPPTINVMDPNGLTGWKSQGFVPPATQFIVGSPAEVRTFHSTSPEGMCYALPRYTDGTLSTVQIDGVICLGKQSSKACFWDNQMMTQGFDFPAGTQIPIGAPNLAIDPQGRYQAGGAELLNGTGGVCTDCHAGENPYIVHPEAVLRAGVTWGSVENSLPAFGINRYDPIVAALWPQNDLSQVGPSVPATCEACHVKGVAGRFPHLSNQLPSYCNTILSQAITKTMPPGSPGSAAAAATAFMNAWCNAAPNAASADTGEPHLTTTNGVHYDFQAAGEFVALRNSDTGFEFQARQSPIQTTFTPPSNPHTGLGGCVSLNSAVALRLGGHRVTYEPITAVDEGPHRMVLRLDGQPVNLTASPITLTSGNTVSGGASGGALDITSSDGTRLTVTPVFWTDQGYWYLDIEVLSTPAREGIMGPVLAGDWLPRAPDGASYGGMPLALLDRHVVLNEKFAHDWRVTPAGSLFDYAAGTSTASFTDTHWPPPPGEACRTSLPSNRPLTHMHPELASLCRVVKDPEQRANCVFDVTVTGDRGAVKGYQPPRCRCPKDSDSHHPERVK